MHTSPSARLHQLWVQETKRRRCWDRRCRCAHNSVAAAQPLGTTERLGRQQGAVCVGERNADAKAHPCRWRVTEAPVHVHVNDNAEGAAFRVIVESSRRLLLDAYLLPPLLMVVRISMHHLQPAQAAVVGGATGGGGTCRCGR